MLNRPLFWLGLLFGAFAAFRLRLFKPRLPPPLPADFLDLVTDPVVVCDSAGTTLKSNVPAQVLFGQISAFPLLRYPTGQRVPPGQHPLYRAALAHETSSGRYHHVAAAGSEHVFDISAWPLPDGKAGAVFRDVTAQQESEAREQAARARQEVVQALCRRLSLAQTAEAMGQAVAEEVHCLLPAVLAVQVRLFLFNPVADTLACLASVPDNRPKRPKSAAEAQPTTVRFDAAVPELWQMYVARKPSSEGLPLIAGGVTIGHLSVSSLGDRLETAAQETLELIASLAALALAGVAAAAQASAHAAQVAAVREIIAALSREPDALADVVAAAVKRVTHAEVCTLSMPISGRLRVIGEAYKDDLLSPQTAPDAPHLHSKATRKAWKTQKSVTHLGMPNPSLEAGPWRAFAGRAGCHSVIALPLAGRGVLSVYTNGASPLPDPQIKFLKTIAALLSLGPPVATESEDDAG